MDIVQFLIHTKYISLTLTLHVIQNILGFSFDPMFNLRETSCIIQSQNWSDLDKKSSEIIVREWEIISAGAGRLSAVRASCIVALGI